ARWMLWRAAWQFDHLQSSTALDARAVADTAVHANEAAWRVADNGVQLLGGAGFIQDFPTEKWLRDTKALALFGPTTELQQLAAAAVFLGAPVGGDLPGSAIQPIFF